MEITAANALLFIAAFIALFFIPGHLFLKRRPIEEKFAASAAIVLAGTLVLSKTMGLSALTLSAFIIALAFLSAILR